MKQETSRSRHNHSILLMLTVIGNVTAQPFAATIVRDSFGVPYIFADSIADAAFGDGYAQAQDRLGLVMDNILTATGTRAARLGAREVERDYRARVTGARHTAYAQWETLPKDVRQVFTGFAAGINRYMEDTTKRLPALARSVEPQEILASMLFGRLYRQMNQAQKDLQGLGANPIAGEGSNGAVMGIYGEVGVPVQLYAALTARNFDAFKRACALRLADGGNIFYTDVEGNIYFTWWNRLNIRNERYDWTRAVDGSTRDTLYQGILPYDKMPQSENDPGAYYQASNAADWALEQGAWGIKPSDFPNWLLTSPKRSTLPARSQRVVDLIRSRPRHSLEDLLEWSLDTRILGAEWVLPLIERACKEHENSLSPAVKQALAVLVDWKKDPCASKASKGYAVYREWLAALGKNSQFNPADMRNQLPMLPAHPEKVPDKAVKPVYRALVRAVESLIKRYDTPTPRWGDINVIELANGTQFPSGAADSVSQGMWQTSQRPKRGPDEKWRCTAGSDGMMIAEMTRPPRVFTMVPYGQSDDPASPHFADQTGRYVQGQYKRVLFTREAIMKNATSQLRVNTRMKP